MLTESERQWLQGRELSDHFCEWCLNAQQCGELCWCPTDRGTAFECTDAAMFEARMVAKLAEAFQYVLHDAPGDHVQDIPCDDCPVKKCRLDCKDSILKWARLQVEEEMDANAK